jgi:(p)ppGpp synthase/HD superfamily hydrolase
MSNYEKALEIATRAHNGQKRWGGQPYITHPEYIADKFKYEHQKIVAILHDVVEDSDIQLEDLVQAGFSNDVITSIAKITKIGGQNYLDYILDLKKDNTARLVKIEDLKHNMSDLKKGSMLDKYQLALYILEH